MTETMNLVQGLLADLDPADRDSGELVFAVTTHTKYGPALVLYPTAAAAAEAIDQAVAWLDEVRPGSCHLGGAVDVWGVRLGIHRLAAGELAEVDVCGEMDCEDENWDDENWEDE